jgi:hypothetical protein
MKFDQREVVAEAEWGQFNAKMAEFFTEKEIWS